MLERIRDKQRKTAICLLAVFLFFVLSATIAFIAVRTQYNIIFNSSNQLSKEIAQKLALLDKINGCSTSMYVVLSNDQLNSDELNRKSSQKLIDSLHNDIDQAISKMDALIIDRKEKLFFEQFKAASLAYTQFAGTYTRVPQQNEKLVDQKNESDEFNSSFAIFSMHMQLLVEYEHIHIKKIANESNNELSGMGKAVTLILTGCVLVSVLVAVIAFWLYKSLVLNYARLEEATSEKEKVTQRFASILNTLPANIALLNNEGTIVDVNNAWKLFAKENGFAGDNYGIGSSYIRGTYSNTPVAIQLQKMIGGELQQFSVIYPCHAPDKKRWFELLAKRENELTNAGIVLMHIDITEKQESEERIKQSKTNLRQIIDLVPHLIFVKNIRGEFILTNKRFAELYGVESPKTLKTKLIMETIPVLEQGEKFMAEDKEVIISGKTKVNPEAFFTDFTGEEHIFHTTRVPYYIAGTNERAVLGVAIEITAQKKAEEELKKAEANYREIFEKASDGIFILDIETGRIINANQKSLNITGYSKDELLAAHPSEISSLNPCFNRNTANRNIWMAEKSGHNIFEWELTKKDGSIHWIEVSCTIANIAGTERIISFFHEIDDRKSAECALRRSEEELRALFSAMTEIVIVLDAEGKYLSIAPTNSSNPYKPAEAVIGRKIQDIMPQENAGKILQYVELALSGLCTVSFEYNLCVGEKDAWFEGSITPLPDNTVFWIARDITERKMGEMDRTKITHDLIQRNKDLEQFAYIISHNLRAPVANILGITSALHSMQLGQDKEKQMKSDLKTCTKKLDDVIKDLNYILQVKREVTERKEILRFSELLTSIQLCIDGMIRKADVQFITDFTAVDEMEAFKSYLYSIFFNLISNSIKYRRPHTPPIIEIFSRKYDNKIELIFRDNGLGIDLEKKGSQVFGLYKRFHSHTEGKGMGLFMTKTQVEALGGKISVHSQVNHGTEFRIEFDNVNKMEETNRSLQLLNQ